MKRDLELIALAPECWDTTAGLAHATNSVIGARHASHARNAARVRACGEMVGRYSALVLAVAPSVLEYRPTMTEAELRKWAFSLVAAVRS